MKLPKDGSTWYGIHGTKFRVITTITLDNKHWVHYINIDVLDEPKEYSCYVESFLERFKELPE